MKGLILEGGGAKGAYQVGAYKALKEMGIEFDGVAGTSVGALNGAYIVQDDIDIIESIWLEANYRFFMDIDEITYNKVKNIDLNPKNFNTIVSFMNKAIKNDGIDISPLRKNLEDTINEEKIRNSKKDFGMVTVWWSNKINPHPIYIEDIPNKKLVDYLIASASLPIFKLEKIDGKLYLDGGFYDNLPIGLLRKKRYKEFVVIRLKNNGKEKKKLNQSSHIKSIVPSEDLGGFLNFDKDNVTKNIKLGYFDAKKTFEEYEGVRYYFIKNNKFSEDYCFNLIKNISEDTISKLCQKLNINKNSSLRTLFEDIVPNLGKLLNLHENFNYKDLIYSIYERELENQEAQRINLYDFEKTFFAVNRYVSSQNINLGNRNINKDILTKSIAWDIINDINNK